MTYFRTYFGEFDYLNSSCIRKSIILILLSSSSDKFTLLYQNSVTDVSVSFWPPCWCPSGWAPAWRLHTNLYKFGQKVSPHILHKKHYCDLKLRESLCIFTFYLFSESGLYLLNGFDFYFEWRDTENQQFLPTYTLNRYKRKLLPCNN